MLYMNVCTLLYIKLFLQEHLWKSHLTPTSSSAYRPTAWALGDGGLASCQASKPPITLVTFLNPARCSRLHAIMLRYPLLQCTARGTS